MYSNETTQSLLRRARHRLDQELDIETNFWSPAEMLEYVNEGVREVWQSVRENHENYFLRQMTSEDGILTIGGRRYDSAALAFVNERSRLLLPPDFRELKLLEAIPDPNQEISGVVFEYANLTQRIFRHDIRSTLPDVIVRRYKYDVVYAADGPYIFISPPVAIETPTPIRIAYIAAPVPLTPNGGFEGMGFTAEMVDAVLAYTCFAAVHKEDLSENIASFGQAWALKRELASRTAGPKQTRDEITVEGYLEEELY